MNTKRIIGITGASGMLYAKRVLEILIAMPGELHLIISEMGWEVLKHELTARHNTFAAFIDELKGAGAIEAEVIIHDIHNLFAPIASGSFQTTGMAIIPCSMKTLSAVATGYTGNLMQRAADVTLKEKRPLILVVRETPFNTVHLKNMVAASEAGATIMPASPGFYNRPETLDDIADFMAGRVLDHLNINYPNAPRWEGE